MARIFIAIRFNEGFKMGLVALQDALKARGVQGNYCPYGNLHMTLAFIGESYDLDAIRKAVSEVSVDPFELSLDKLGSFPTKTGVIWCGVKDNAPIIDLARQLRDRLKANGVSFKDDVFFPHISLVQHPSEIVTKDVEPNTMVAGNPAKLIRRI
ncbi:MAG: RNA 2',3'-cyclic phosphodiesterase [Prevotellaceae bacterium]|nr:RNA 2',3'-cyclic phosphodiesterase [Prevotellaceae bacterium]